MRLDDQFRECVAFLRMEPVSSDTDRDELTPVATAFFVGVPLTANVVEPYVVTAAHVVQEARANGKPLVIRLNCHDGWEDVAIPVDAWLEHPISDVAVASVALRSEVHDVLSIPLRILADETFLSDLDVGEGDEVFMSGLFTGTHGEAKDQPIVRFGNIALGNREPLLLKMPSGETRMRAA